MTDTELTRYIDEWLDENAWRLDGRLLDFVLDVRLMAAGSVPAAAEDAREPVGAGSPA